MIVLISWIAGIVGSCYPIPQVVRALKRKHSHGVSEYFLVLWLIEKLCSLIYATSLNAIPLMVKYSVGLLAVLIILYYKIKPKEIINK